MPARRLKWLRVWRLQSVFEKSYNFKLNSFGKILSKNRLQINQWNLRQRAVLVQVPCVLTRAPWRKRNVRVPRRRRPCGTGARSTSRLHTRPPAAPCSPSPGCAAPLGRSHADAGDGGGAGAGAAAAPARQPCGRRASIDAFTVARDGTPLPRAALRAKVELV